LGLSAQTGSFAVRPNLAFLSQSATIFATRGRGVPLSLRLLNGQDAEHLSCSDRPSAYLALPSAYSCRALRGFPLLRPIRTTPTTRGSSVGAGKPSARSGHSGQVTVANHFSSTAIGIRKPCCVAETTRRTDSESIWAVPFRRPLSKRATVSLSSSSSPGVGVSMEIMRFEPRACALTAIVVVALTSSLLIASFCERTVVDGRSITP